MKRAAGLWADHRKAVVGVVTDKGEETKLILSKVERQLRRSGDSPLKAPYEVQRLPLDDSRQGEFTGQLNIYYDAVIACIRDTEAILIFDPGEARASWRNIS